MRWTFLICAAALAACSPAPETSGQDAPGASAEPVSTGPRTYDALSKTAEAFTGALTMTELDRVGPNAPQRYLLAAANGHTWEISYAGKATLDDAIGDDVFGSFFQVPEQTPIALYAVDQEQVKPGTPNGGLCMPGKTGFLAIAESGDSMEIAAFSGAAWPPPANKPPPLCGTFNYAVRK
jgi:hypothetical protein